MSSKYKVPTADEIDKITADSVVIIEQSIVIKMLKIQIEELERQLEELKNEPSND